MTGLYEEGHNTQPSSDRPDTINCAVLSYIILHLYDLHQSNLGGEGNSHVLWRSAGAPRSLVTRSNIGITGTSWGAQLVIEAHLCLKARKQNKWSKQKIVPLGCYLLQVWVHGMLIHIHVGVQHVPISCKWMNYL